MSKLYERFQVFDQKCHRIADHLERWLNITAILIFIGLCAVSIERLQRPELPYSQQICGGK